MKQVDSCGLVPMRSYSVSYNVQASTELGPENVRGVLGCYVLASIEDVSLLERFIDFRVYGVGT